MLPTHHRANQKGERARALCLLVVLGMGVTYLEKLGSYVVFADTCIVREGETIRSKAAVLERPRC